ncbi:MAG: polysaccharide biosynthesis tyrosine autokinase [Hyphomicrobiaceae bacterium]
MAERVASAIKAGDDLDLFKPRDFSIVNTIKGWISGAKAVDPAQIDPAAREQWAAGIIAGGVAVVPVAGSRLVDVVFTDSNPGRAARIANAYAEAYINQMIDKRFQSNAYAKTFLDDQSKQLKIRLEESERALLDFSEQKEIIVLNEKSSIAESNLAAANSALSGIIASRITNEQTWRQVENVNALELPQFLSNGVIQELRSARKALEIQYQEKSETFKADYPLMIELRRKMKEIDRQLAIEVKTVKASLKGAYESLLLQEKETKAQIESLRVEVLDLQKKLIQYNILKREVDTNRSLYNGILQRLKEVEVAGGVGTNNVFIVDRAKPPGSPTSPNVSRALMMWSVLGLGAGIAAAYILEMLDDTVRTVEKLEQTTGLATLGIIPKVDSGQTAEQELLDPRSGLMEAYRSFGTSLQFSTDHGLPKTLLITSSSPAEGKSVTALAVARHFATMGLKVLLIDADLRNPSLHNKLQIANGMGLSNYLTGGCAPPDVLMATDLPNLAFLPTGPLPPNAADLLAGSRFHSLLATGLEVFDFIIIDGPPVMGLADAQLLSTSVSATVFVVGAGQARVGAVKGALKRMELARAPMIGTVLTKFDSKSAGYGYAYGYSYGKDPFQYGRHVEDAGGTHPALPNGGERA